MKGKLLLIGVGLAVGFLLGSRAGREPYERFSGFVKKVWTNPRVQTQVDRSVAFANDKFEEVAGIVTTGAKNVVDRVTAPKPRSTAPKKRPQKPSAG